MNPFNINKSSVKTLCAILIVRRRRRRHRRKYWVHPITSERLDNGKFALLHSKLIEYPDKFFEYYRMSIPSFETLLAKVKNSITKCDTNMRDSISAEEQLAVTLRYLATGNSIRSLHFEFLLGRSTISSIITNTCQAIWNEMKEEYMKEPCTEEWKTISEQYEKRANFPQCLGAIDGKHIRVIKPWGSGSEYFNYKKFFSIVLMGVVDSNYYFRYIDVGSFGHEGDSNILKATDLGKKIYQKTLNLPQPVPLKNDPSGQPMPYVFVADEAFAMCENVMRPYPAKKLTRQQRIFNYRLSRARRFVECAFGILANKWRILHRPIDISIDKADIIIQACCVLHNFVRHRDGYHFEDTLSCPMESVPAIGTRGNNIGVGTRDNFKNYFCSSAGSVPWQNRSCNIAE